MRFAVQAALSIVLGFFLMAPLATLFETMRWPMFHGWALAHGTFLIAWPALAVVSFVVLSLVPRFRRDFRDDLAVGSAALVGAGILTAVEWPGRRGWLFVVIAVAIAFGSSAALSVLARRKKLVPVAMTLPMLLTDSTQMTRTTVPVAIGAVAGFVVAVTVLRRLERTQDESS